MRFMFVNQEGPRHGGTCSACAQPLGASYVRHVPAERRYCDYDCYRRYQQTTVEMLWPYRSSLEAITVSSWNWILQTGALSRSLTEAFLRAYEPSDHGRR
jgi:hypothetical protein